MRRHLGLLLSCTLASTIACGDEENSSGDDGSGASSGASSTASAETSESTAGTDDGAEGGSGQGDFLGSCDTRSENGECRDWVGQPGADLEVSCNGIGGAYSGDTPCPVENRVGRCNLAPVLGTSAVYNYYAPTWDEAGAQMDCAGFQDGTFEPG